MGINWSASLNTGTGLITSIPAWMSVSCASTGRTTQVSASAIVTGLGANVNVGRNSGNGDGLSSYASVENINPEAYLRPAGHWGAGDNASIGNGGTAPDGSTTSGRVTFTSGDPPNEFVFAVNNMSVVGGSIYTHSIWAYGISGTETFVVRFWSAGGGLYSSDITASGAWSLFSATSAAMAYNSSFAAIIRNGTTDSNCAVDFYGYQVETGLYPGPLVPTSGASATVNANLISCTDPTQIAPSGNYDITMIVRPWYAYNETAGDHWYLYFGAASGLYYKQSDQKFYLQIPGSADIVSSAMSFARNDWLRFRVTHLVSGRRLQIWDAADTVLYDSGVLSAGTALTLGATAGILGTGAATTDHADLGTFNIEYTGGTTYSVSVSDAIAVTDSITNFVEYRRQPSDAVSVSDSVADYLTRLYDIALSDAIAVTDSIAERAEYHRPLSDSVAVTDSISAYTSTLYDVSTSDSVAASDAIGERAEYHRPLADSAVVSDSTTAYITTLYDISLSDSIATSDSIGERAEYHRPLSDASAVTDVVSAYTETVYIVARTDSASITDAISERAEYHLPLSDATAVTDLISQRAEYHRPLSDTVAVTDTVSATVVTFYDVLLSDTIVATDATGERTEYHRPLSDVVAVSDSISAYATTLYSVSLTDAIIATDATGERAEYHRPLSDVVATTDTVSATVIVFIDVYLADSSTVSDSPSDRVEYHRPFVDSVDTTDVVSGSISTLYDISISDSVSVTDTILNRTEYHRQLTDSVAVTDSLSAVLYSVIDLHLSDSFSASDAIRESADYHRYLTDGASISDEIGVHPPLNDSIGVSDLAGEAAEYSRPANDNAIISDSVEVLVIQPAVPRPYIPQRFPFPVGSPGGGGGGGGPIGWITFDTPGVPPVLVQGNELRDPVYVSKDGTEVYKTRTRLDKLIEDAVARSNRQMVLRRSAAADDAALRLAGRSVASFFAGRSIYEYIVGQLASSVAVASESRHATVSQAVAPLSNKVDTLSTQLGALAPQLDRIEQSISQLHSVPSMVSSAVTYEAPTLPYTDGAYISQEETSLYYDAPPYPAYSSNSSPTVTRSPWRTVVTSICLIGVAAAVVWIAYSLSRSKNRLPDKSAPTLKSKTKRKPAKKKHKASRSRPRSRRAISGKALRLVA